MPKSQLCQNDELRDINVGVPVNQPMFPSGKLTNNLTLLRAILFGPVLDGHGGKPAAFDSAGIKPAVVGRGDHWVVTCCNHKGFGMIGMGI